MAVVDTSTWLNHFHNPVVEVVKLIEQDEALVHTFVLGELALGQQKFRREILADLSVFRMAPKAEDNEVMELIERFKLFGSGIGWVDCHLIASARIAGVPLLTHDLALKQAWLRIR